MVRESGRVGHRDWAYPKLTLDITNANNITNNSNMNNNSNIVHINNSSNLAHIVNTSNVCISDNTGKHGNINNMSVNSNYSNVASGYYIPISVATKFGLAYLAVVGTGLERNGYRGGSKRVNTDNISNISNIGKCGSMNQVEFMDEVSTGGRGLK